MMNIIEEATRRLEELARAGVSVPWSASGPATGQVRAIRSAEGVATLDRPFQKAQPASDRIGPPLGATLNLTELASAGFLVPGQTKSSLAEEFRCIKRPLLNNARSSDSVAKRLPLIMMTSALPGEGKTFCAINLAMSMAIEIDFSVLLVDADVMRADVPKQLGFQAGKGLIDLLMEPDLDPSDVILETNVPGLSILPAGQCNPLSTELLASEAMGSLLTTLVDRYPNHIVIFDSPPLLVTNEAKVLASRVGQVVMVVEASKTPCGAVAQAFAALEPGPLRMSMINKAIEPPASPYGYGYGYGY